MSNIYKEHVGKGGEFDKAAFEYDDYESHKLIKIEAMNYKYRFCGTLKWKEEAAGGECLELVDPCQQKIVLKRLRLNYREFGIITEKHIVVCVTDGDIMMIDLVENTVEVEDKSHEEEDNSESEELVEDLDKALDLEFESGKKSQQLIDIKEEQMMVNVEFETVTTIVKGLKPVKIGLEKLCSPNATLLTAEGVFSFVIGELNEQNSEFAKNMKYSLIQRMNETER
ncbi:uncharacterized protein TNCV_424281 [Trichonephila clavipes]|nr:uncharacterized protein TNCV_424281 [Trichonephila clavipes]